MAKFRVSQRYQIFNHNQRSEILELFKDSSIFNLDEYTSDIGEKSDEDTSFEANESVSETGTVDEHLDNFRISEEIKNEHGLKCSVCDIKFLTGIDQRQHFRLDWHRYNLKRKSHKQGTVNEEEFQEMMDGLSSISGSDDDYVAPNQLSRLIEKVTCEDSDESSSPIERKAESFLKNQPKIFFKSKNDQVFAFHTSVLPHQLAKWKRDATVIDKVLPHMTQIAQVSPKWGVIMISGGHFAAGLFEGTTELVHKTFHSYTVRAKQGGAQSARDSKSATSHPKSAGASLRRYNEQVFNQHIQEILESWKEGLGQCELIFYRAASFNQNILFRGQSAPFNKSDPRLKTIPFRTKRPTYGEVKRVLFLLTIIEVFGDAEAFKTLLLRQNVSEKTNKAKRIDRAKSRSPVKRDEPEIPSVCLSDDEDDVVELDEPIYVPTSDLEEFGDSLTDEKRKRKAKKKKPKTDKFIKPTGTLGLAVKAIEDRDNNLVNDLIVKLRIEFPNDASFWNQPVNEHSLTLLHYAVKYDLHEIVWKLLEFGCDPALKDKNGKYPYNFAATKDGRKVFMRFQAQFPEMYNYSKAHIPGPLTKEMEDERAEKQRALRKIKKEKEHMKMLAKKEQEMKKQAEIDERNRFLNLSDREKRALAAERRILESKRAAESQMTTTK